MGWDLNGKLRTGAGTAFSGQAGRRASQLAVTVDHVEREFRPQPGALQSRAGS
jgi:hypothetical protein